MENALKNMGEVELMTGPIGCEDGGRARSHDDFMFYLLGGGLSTIGWSQKQ